MSSLWAVARTVARASEHCLPQHGHDCGQSNMTLVAAAAFVLTNNRTVKMMVDSFILFLRLCTDNIQNIVDTVASCK